MKKLAILLILLLSVVFAETVPVLIDGKEYKGEKIGNYIFVLDNKLVIYENKSYELIKIDNFYISKDLKVVLDGNEVNKIISFGDIVFYPKKNLLFKNGKKYEVKNWGNVYFSLTGYNYDWEGFKLFAYGIFPQMKYVLLEICIFNLDSQPVTLQQNMFKLKIGNSIYYPDGSASVILNNEGKEVLFRKIIYPGEATVGYLVFDVPTTPEKLIIDPQFGLKNPLEINMP
ncbi:MAG: hypothetical protein CBR30_03080 [Dictyoglomus sp. NZ13-RE01]|nr:MAG: hypothetical protein CBR30_03080 [Dictyoglomus sp. NZ13-RE01]